MLENPVAFCDSHFPQNKNEAWPVCKGAFLFQNFIIVSQTPKGASL